MGKGYIYIMTNQALRGMVKIGFATDVEVRRRQLSTTALPFDYEVYAVYETTGNLEDKKLHKMIDQLNPKLRVNKKREFFDMSPEDAYELLEAIATISGTKGKLSRTIPKKERETSIIRKEPEAMVEKAVELEILNDATLEPKNSNVVPDGEYYLTHKMKKWNDYICSATMKVVAGKYIVQKGAVLSPIRGKGWTTTKVIDIRRESAEIGNNILLNDESFDSPSLAAAFVTFAPENGWTAWKDADGRPIDIYRKGEKAKAFRRLKQKGQRMSLNLYKAFPMIL